MNTPYLYVLLQQRIIGRLAPRREKPIDPGYSRSRPKGAKGEREGAIMNEQNNMEYYQSRARQERELARMSADASIARIHIEMAEHYEKVVESASGKTSGNSNQLAG